MGAEWGFFVTPERGTVPDDRTGSPFLLRRNKVLVKNQSRINSDEAKF
jgi:hypothetical protein